MTNYKSVLQENELKSTPARLAVLRYLAEQHKPLDAESIYVHIGREHKKADKTTIYRILERLSAKGIITKFEFREGKYRYELAGDDHHHLLCESCGNILDFSDCKIELLEKEIEQKKKFLVKKHQLEFFGICELCQS